MAEYTITVRGDKETIDRLKKLGGGIINLRGAMDDIGRYLTGFFSGQVFASRGQVIGRPWPRLNPRYEAWKARRYPGRPTLVRTGLMQRSFKHDAGKDTSRIFNEADYFGPHQLGKRVPQRVMMRVDAQRRRETIRIVEGHIKKAGATS